MECVELAGEERGGHEVPSATIESLGEEGASACEVDEAYVGVGGAEDVAIPAFECRAGDDESHTFRARFAKSASDGFEPSLPVFIGQRNARRHASDILRRVESVALDESDVQCVGESFTDDSLPRTGDAHDHVPRGPRAVLVHGRTGALDSLP